MTKPWTRAEAVIIRKLARIADDCLSAAIISAPPAAKYDLLNDRSFVRLILAEAETSLRRVVAVEKRRAA